MYNSVYKQFYSPQLLKILGRRLFTIAPSGKEKNVIPKEGHRVLSHFPNASFKVVAIGASMGGLKAISEILSTLPSDFPAAIVIVQHLSPKHISHMAEILSRRTALRVKQAEAGDMLCPGTVYIAPPNKHLLVNPDATLSLSDAAKVKFVRPAADKLFASVATSFKMRAIAVILTGRDGDGVLGVLEIKKHGGTIIAQNEATCECFSMPKSAIDTGTVDFVLPLKEIASTLVSLIVPEKVA